jgi:hypothetical protein
MQFLTAKSVLYIRAAWLLFITYYLAFDAKYLCTIGFVILLGQAMEVKFVMLNNDNPLLGIVCLLFGLLVVSDVVPLMAENYQYFESIVPIRLCIFFGIAAYSYLVKTSILSNCLIFTYAFFEIWLNFLIYNNLRDEKYYRLKKFVEENEDKIREVEAERIVVVDN